MCRHHHDCSSVSHSWVSEHTSRDRIRNEDIRIANNEGKIKKKHLTWFGRVQRQGIRQPEIKIES